MKKTLIILLITTNLIVSEDIKTLPSYQGFSGLWNTPNAKVINEGEGQFVFTNQVDNLHPENKNFRDNKEAENYFLNFGALPNFEFSGRYAYIKDNISDSIILSDRTVSAKYELPFSYRYLPSIAIGMQDIGGAVPNFRTNYIVASSELNDFRFSLGYGSGEKRMEGLFGGVEYQPLSWVQLVADYDGEETHSGIKLSYPLHLLDKDIEFGLFVKNSYGYNKSHFDIGAMIYVPLGIQENKIVKSSINNKSEKSLGKQRVYSQTTEAEPSDSNSFKSSTNQIVNDNSSNSSAIESVHQKLIAYGFTDIEISDIDNLFYLEYENSAFDWNDMDGLGVVLGVMTKYLHKEKNNFIVTIKKSEIPLFSISGSFEKYNEFLNSGKYSKNLLHIGSPIDTKDISDIDDNSNRFLPNLILYPDWSLVDGSEYGHLDYIVSLKPELYTTVAKGTQISARWNIPLSWSNNYEDGKVFSYRRRYPLSPQIDNLLLNMTYKPFTSSMFLNSIQAGLFDVDLYGGMYQGLFSKENHQFKVKIAHFDDQKYEKNRDMQLISYRYYLDTLDSNFKITYGEYFYGDKGTTLEMKRFFGDTSLSLKLSHTKDDNIGRFALSFPLTPRKRVNSNLLQVRGDKFTYNRQKTIVRKGEICYAKPRSAIEINTNFELEKFYLNDDRFSADYIYAHIPRLRSSYLKFK
ncbi:MAG: YjbH domain-containing protein [Sulfurovaceae bacterium]|nr:YjbH domain-containing protein [Sulfurovaceae bacterium]